MRRNVNNFFLKTIAKRQFWVSRPASEDDIKMDVKETVRMGADAGYNHDRIQWQSLVSTITKLQSCPCA
jgi:hypothetical protein